MSLIAYGNSAPPAQHAAIANNGFWPELATSDFRDAERIDSTVTDTRLIQALRIAVADINRQLAAWQLARQDEGAASVNDVTVPIWAVEGHYSLLYRRAVYATAMASLMERYRHYSATSDGDERGEAKDLAADDYRRDAHWAVAELTGRTRTTVELI